MKRHSLLYIQSFLAHGIGLLLVIILLVVAQDFIAARPALAAILVFAFSLSYVAASVRSREAYYLYGGMLLGAASYFMACHSLGAPVSWFPPLSVPLVFALWVIGWRLTRVLPEERALFPATTFRAMNITVAAFAAFSVWQIPSLITPAGTLGIIAAGTLFGYAVLYLLHASVMRSRLYACAFSAFLLAALSLGAVTLFQLGSLSYAFLLAALVLLLVGTVAHRTGGLYLSRYYYAAFGIALVLALAAIYAQPLEGLYVCAIGTALCTLGYLLLTLVVSDVVRATSDERLTAKYFINASFLFSAPIAPFIFMPGLSRYWAVPALIAGIAFSAHAWFRRADKHSPRNLYVYLSATLISAAVIGGATASVYSFAIALFVVTVHLLAFQRLASRLSFAASQHALAESLAVPAFFAWYIPLMAGDANLALAGALAGFALLSLVFLVTNQRAFLCGLGPAVAGAWILAAPFLASAGQMPSWLIVVGGAALTGIAFGAGSLVASIQPIRLSLGFSWLVLSAMGPAVAYAGGNAADAVLAAAGMGLVAVLVSGLLHLQRKTGGLFEMSAWVLALLGVASLAALGIPVGLGAATVSLGLACFAVTAVLMGLLCRSLWLGRFGLILFAVSGILLSYVYTADLHQFLLFSSVVPLTLFTVAAIFRGRESGLAPSASAIGHAATAALGALLLTRAYSVAVTPPLALALIPYAGLYLAGAFVWRTSSFRFGAVLCISALIVFSIAGYLGVPYAMQAYTAVLLAALWTALGALFSERAAPTWAKSLFLAAAWVAAGAILLPLIEAPDGEAWHIFLTAGLVYACLSMILRQDIFAYLVTLCLAMMVYDWVRVTTSHFTQDVLFYPLIAAIVLSVFLLLPHIKQLTNRLASLPVFNIFSAVGATLAVVPIMGGSAFFMSAYSLKVTAHPRFCTSCHYMDQYYDSWSHSSHKDVACIECHYEPGLKSELLGKGDGLIQMIKYLSHSYSNRPHGIVSNASCMRSGCHDNIADSDKMLLFDGKIRFRHDSHLGDHPRGHDLNCVSCHGQMVQGQHISVTQSTCITCHFFGRDEEAVAIGDCLSCHAVLDETVTIGNEVFDHPAFLADKATVDCAHCHSQVTQGHGEVSEMRCNTCHLGPHEPIDDIEEFHLVHAQVKQFDCLQCHDKIRHGVHPRDQQMLFSAADCAACHTGERHTIQKRIYAGNALPELELTPDFMYVAGVTCDGCHTSTKMINIGEMTLTGKVSSPKQCSDCHADENYGELLADWQTEIRELVEDLQTDIDALVLACEAAVDVYANVDSALEHINEAQSKVNIVVRDGSYGGHNYFYITSILYSAGSDLSAARLVVADWDADEEEDEEATK